MDTVIRRTEGFNGTGFQGWKHRLGICVGGCCERLLALMNLVEAQDGAMDPTASISEGYRMYNFHLY